MEQQRDIKRFAQLYGRKLNVFSNGKKARMKKTSLLATLQIFT
jgi:hypothetical protein